MIRVLVGAPLASVRAGLRAMLEAAGDIQVAGESPDGADLARLYEVLRPDILVVDSLPAPEGVPVVRLSEAPEALGRLPSALLPRDAEAEELAAAVRAVAAGLVVTSPNLLSIDMPVRHTGLELDEPLTAREREVLQLLAEGIPNKQIARRLGVSAHTVKFHVASLLAKLGAASRTEAVAVGLRRGLISF